MSCKHYDARWIQPCPHCAETERRRQSGELRKVSVLGDPDIVQELRQPWEARPTGHRRAWVETQAAIEIEWLRAILARIFDHFGPPQDGDGPDDPAYCECLMCEIQREQRIK